MVARFRRSKDAHRVAPVPVPDADAGGLTGPGVREDDRNGEPAPAAPSTPPPGASEQQVGGAGAPIPQSPVPALSPPRRTRFSGLWISLILAALVLILLLVFILENSSRVDIAFFGFHGHLPLGVALLLAAVSGMLLLALPGTGRIIQLRRQVQRGRKAYADDHLRA